MRVKVGNLEGNVVWSTETGTFIQFDVYLAKHGWHDWHKVEVLSIR